MTPFLLYGITCPIFGTRFGIRIYFHDVAYLTVHVEANFLQYIYHDIAAVLELVQRPLTDK